MSNSFVSKDVAVEVAVVDRKVSTVEGGSSGERERQEGRERKGEREGGGHQIMMWFSSVYMGIFLPNI